MLKEKNKWKQQNETENKRNTWNIWAPIVNKLRRLGVREHGQTHQLTHTSAENSRSHTHTLARIRCARCTHLNRCERQRRRPTHTGASPRSVCRLTVCGYVRVSTSQLLCVRQPFGTDERSIKFKEEEEEALTCEAQWNERRSLAKEYTVVIRLSDAANTHYFPISHSPSFVYLVLIVFLLLSFPFDANSFNFRSCSLSDLRECAPRRLSHCRQCALLL